MKPGPVLAVPAFEKGGGGGHLVRSAALVRDLRSAGREAWLCVPGHTRETLPRDLPDLTGAAGGGWFFPETEIPSRRWSLIILDRFKTSPEEYARWSALGPVLGIDEGGPVRDNFDFLIDPLPTPPGARAPNMSSPALIPLPKNRRPSFVRESSGPFKILVTFGAEDPAELAAPVARACIPPERPSAAGEKPPAVEITLVAGPLGDPAGMPTETGGLRVLRGFPELRERLADYDLAITHFGLTAFEALHGRTPVILVSPGTYH